MANHIDLTIPAPAGTICPKCQRVVKSNDWNIVRFNTRIFHHACFVIWFPARKYGKRSAQHSAQV